ncbi:MAG: NAD(P)H-hydrate dehydratase [Aestuariivirgaceae bacterium]
MATAQHTSPSSNGLELLTPVQMYAADAATIAAGTPGIELMENAGYAVFREIVLRWSKRPVAVLCGPGNNGGDGFVVARLLAEEGWPVCLSLAGDAAKLKGDAALAAKAWGGAPEPAKPKVLDGARLIVDALFGAGLGRAIGGELASIIGAANRSGAPVVAVDIPSGIDGADGQARGTAIEASLTVTFCRRKPGHLLLPGRSHCGETVCADIGIAADAVPAGQSPICANSPMLWQHHFSAAAPDTHKYTRGHALVVSGKADRTGAARLAANAALCAGAGLVTLASPGSALLVNAAHLTAVMLAKADQPRDLGLILADKRLAAAAIGPGCGVGGRTRAKVRTVLASGAAAVLDADALTSFEQDPATLFTAIAEDPQRPVVLTPHEGEFKRLFKDLDGSADSKYERACAAAERCAAVVVLKGADTVIAAPDGRVLINDNAPSGLATAGSGDVLAGIVLAGLCRRIPPFEAAAAAVWLHGAAAAGHIGPFTADDLAGLLPAAIASIQK